jgi:hypothetical protein
VSIPDLIGAAAYAGIEPDELAQLHNETRQLAREVRAALERAEARRAARLRQRPAQPEQEDSDG